MLVRLNRVHLAGRSGIQRDIQAGSGSDLDNPSRQSAHQPAPLFPNAHSLAGSKYGVVDLREERAAHEDSLLPSLRV